MPPPKIDRSKQRKVEYENEIYKLNARLHDMISMNRRHPEEPDVLVYLRTIDRQSNRIMVPDWKLDRNRDTTGRVAYDYRRDIDWRDK